MTLNNYLLLFISSIKSKLYLFKQKTCVAAKTTRGIKFCFRLSIRLLLSVALPDGWFCKTGRLGAVTLRFPESLVKIQLRWQ